MTRDPQYIYKNIIITRFHVNPMSHIMETKLKFNWLIGTFTSGLDGFRQRNRSSQVAINLKSYIDSTYYRLQAQLALKKGGGPPKLPAEHFCSATWNMSLMVVGNSDLMDIYGYSLLMPPSVTRCHGPYVPFKLPPSLPSPTGE